MKFSALRFGIYIWFLFPSQSSATTLFTFSEISCSPGLIVASDLSASCGGDELCTWGSVVFVSGEVEITGEGLPSTNADAAGTIMSVFTIFEEESVDICGCLTPVTEEEGQDDGQSEEVECPGAGTYTLDEFDAFSIPTGDMYSGLLVFDMNITLQTTFNFHDEEESSMVCTVVVTLNNSSGMASAAAAMFVVGLAGIVGYGIRKRRVATIQLSEEEGTCSHFEMMPNGDCVEV